jgi:hypothetical protein
MIDMIQLVNPENPVKVRMLITCTSRGSEKNLTLLAKIYCCTDETLCYYLLTLRRGAEERDVCHGR